MAISPDGSTASEPTGASPSALAAVSGAAIVVVWTAILLDALADLHAAVPAAIAGLAAYLAAQAPHLPRHAWGHLAAGAATAVVGGVVLDDPWPALGQSLARAAFLAALFTALGMLREAARTAESILQAGRMLVAQPPGRRYIAITAGGTLFGAVLNFGAVALLSSLIQASNTLQAAGGDERVRRIREQRMMLALLRGFSTLMFWCPLTLAFALVTATIPGARWPAMIGLGTVATVSVMAAGWLLDRLTMPRRRGTAPSVPFRWRHLMPLLALIGLVSALAIAVEELTSGRLIHGVILVVPLIATAWLAFGERGRVLSRLQGYLTESVPEQRGEIAVLGNAAFLGTMVAALLVEAGLQDGLVDVGLPAVAIPVLALWTPVVVGQLGANPLITVTVLATVLGAHAAQHVDGTILGMGLVMGWGLTVGSSPAAAATLLIGRMTGHSAGWIGRRWNGPYTLLALTLCSGFLMALHALW